MTTTSREAAPGSNGREDGHDTIEVGTVADHDNDTAAMKRPAMRKSDDDDHERRRRLLHTAVFYYTFIVLVSWGFLFIGFLFWGYIIR